MYVGLFVCLMCVYFSVYLSVSISVRLSLCNFQCFCLSVWLLAAVRLLVSPSLRLSVRIAAAFRLLFSSLCVTIQKQTRDSKLCRTIEAYVTSIALYLPKPNTSCKRWIRPVKIFLPRAEACPQECLNMAVWDCGSLRRYEKCKGRHSRLLRVQVVVYQI